MNEKKSLLENVMNFFRFVPKKKTVDKSKDDEADDVQHEKLKVTAMIKFSVISPS